MSGDHVNEPFMWVSSSMHLVFYSATCADMYSLGSSFFFFASGEDGVSGVLLHHRQVIKTMSEMEIGSYYHILHYHWLCLSSFQLLKDNQMFLRLEHLLQDCKRRPTCDFFDSCLWNSKCECNCFALLWAFSRKLYNCKGHVGYYGSSKCSYLYWELYFWAGCTFSLALHVWLDSLHPFCSHDSKFATFIFSLAKDWLHFW